MNQNTDTIAEEKRLDALRYYNILDTPAESDFDDIVKLASQICDTPISLISLIDHNRQWFKARVGLEVTETPREIAFCNYTIQKNELFEVRDAFQDVRFAHNSLVTDDPNIRAYAGYPLTTPDGYNLGTLCVIDSKPKQLNDFQKEALKILAERVMKELELRVKMKERDAANLFNERLIAILSHDMRNPLGTVLITQQMLEQDLISVKEQSTINKSLSGQVKNVLSLLDNILSWSELNTQKAREITYAVEEVLFEVIALLTPQAQLKHISFDTDIIDVKLRGEPKMLSLIFRNILTNAIKYSQEGGKISISTEFKDRTAYIEVKDQGVGMNDEQLKALLERTPIISIPGTHKERGSGLGMRLSQELLEAHKGKLTISSREGEGTTVVIAVPNT